jgi:acetyl esterase
VGLPVHKAIRSLIARAEKLQGTTVRATMRMPAFTQRRIAKRFGFNPAHAELDPHLQMLLVLRDLVGNPELLSGNADKSRRHFRRDMASLISKPTAVGSVKELSIPTRAGQQPARLYAPKLATAGNAPLPLLLFIHGGGFMIGDLDTIDEACRVLCQNAGVRVLSISYRLSPEHPAPAAVEDCLDALQWAHANAAKLGADPRKIVVGGDSAGGNLSAVLSQQSKGLPYAPAAQLLIYPVVDQLNDYPSHVKYGNGLFLNKTDMNQAKKFYVLSGNVSLKDPLVSPLFGDLTDLPPAILITAGLDALRDEGELYAVKLREAGSPCHAYRVEGQGHGFINITPINKAAFEHTVKIAHELKALLATL